MKLNFISAYRLCFHRYSARKRIRIEGSGENAVVHMIEDKNAMPLPQVDEDENNENEEVQ